MKSMCLSHLFALLSITSIAQNESEVLLFDGLNDGSTYSGEEGLLTLKGLPNCNITSYSITLPSKEIIGGISNPFAQETLDKIKSLPSGSTFTFAVGVGCPGPSRKQLSAEFVAP